MTWFGGAIVETGVATFTTFCPELPELFCAATEFEFFLLFVFLVDAFLGSELGLRFRRLLALLGAFWLPEAGVFNAVWIDEEFVGAFFCAASGKCSAPGITFAGS